MHYMSPRVRNVSLVLARHDKDHARDQRPV
jgi:hypothetical protein